MSRIRIGNRKALRVVSWNILLQRRDFTKGSHHRKVDKCTSFCPAEKQTSLRARPSASFPRNRNAKGRWRMENPVATARLILLLCRKVSTTKPLAAPPPGVLLRRGHAYPNRRSALTYPCPASPIPRPLSLFLQYHRPSIDLRARKTWKILRKERTNWRNKNCVVRMYVVNQK